MLRWLVLQRHSMVCRHPDSTLPHLFGAVLTERHDQWTEGRRYLGLDLFARCRIRPLPTDATHTGAEEVTNPALSA